MDGWPLRCLQLPTDNQRRPRTITSIKFHGHLLPDEFISLFLLLPQEKKNFRRVAAPPPPGRRRLVRLSNGLFAPFIHSVQSELNQLPFLRPRRLSPSPRKILRFSGGGGGGGGPEGPVCWSRRFPHSRRREVIDWRDKIGR